MAQNIPEDPRVPAIFDLVARTGAAACEVRYSESDDGTGPTAWLAIATYPGGLWEVGGGTCPGVACWRLGETLIDGGTCAHCHRPTFLVEPDQDGLDVERAGLPASCQWTLRGERVARGCE